MLVISAVALIPSFILVKDLGLPNTYWALILPHPFKLLLNGD